MVMWGSMMEGLAEGYKTGSDIYARSQEQKLKRQERADQKKEQEITRLGAVYNMTVSAAEKFPEEERVPRINAAGRPYYEALGANWIDLTTYGTAEQRLAKDLQKIQEQIQAGTISKTQAKSEVASAYIRAGKNNPEISEKMLGITQEEERLAQYVKNNTRAKVIEIFGSGNKEQLYKANAATPGADPEMVAWEALDPKAYVEGLESGVDYVEKLRKAELRGRASTIIELWQTNPEEATKLMVAREKAKQGDIFGDESLGMVDGGEAGGERFSTPTTPPKERKSWVEWLNEPVFGGKGPPPSGMPSLSSKKREKGLGFFGELKRPDGKISTELSFTFEVEGKEIEAPLLVPTLTQDEINLLLRGETTPEIYEKAQEHALKRLEQGKNPFAQKGEQTSQGKSPSRPEEGADELPSPSAHNEGAIIKFPSGNRYVLQDGQWQLLPPAASTPRALRGEVQNQRFGLVPRSFTRTEPFPNTLGQSRQF